MYACNGVIYPIVNQNGRCVPVRDVDICFNSSVCDALHVVLKEGYSKPHPDMRLFQPPMSLGHVSQACGCLVSISINLFNSFPLSGCVVRISSRTCKMSANTGDASPTRVFQWIVDTRNLWPQATQTAQLKSHVSQHQPVSARLNLHLVD